MNFLQALTDPTATLADVNAAAEAEYREREALRDGYSHAIRRADALRNLRNAEDARNLHRESMDNNDLDQCAHLMHLEQRVRFAKSALTSIEREVER